MTDMRRVTISMPDALDKQILSLRADERFAKCTYAEIVRRVLEIGLSSTDEASEGEGRGEIWMRKKPPPLSRSESSLRK